MTKRKALPRKFEEEVYQQFGSKCPFCDETDVNTLQVHHIIPHAEAQEYHVENQLLTCTNYHQKIENGEIPARDVYAAKFRFEQDDVNPREPKPETRDNTLSFRGANTGIVANTINFSSKSGAMKQGSISGAVGLDLARRNYVKYLIDRYHEFRKADIGKRGMNYAILYDGIRRKFGAKWDNLPVHAFSALVEYLQKGRYYTSHTQPAL